MIILLLIIAVISAILLILVVMVQDEQGEGLGGIFGGGSGSPFGSRTGNVLTRITSILSIIFIVCTFVLALLNKTPMTDSTINAAREDRFQSSSDAGWYTKIQSATEESGSGESLYSETGNDSATTDQSAAESESAPAGDTAAGNP